VTRLPAQYDGIARTLHWLIAVLIVMQFLLGWLMPDIHRNTVPEGLIAWHLAVGATIVAAMLIRILWRVTHRPPPPVDLPKPIGALSKATHLLLYAALICVPVLGWINASSRGWRVALPGGLPLPSLSTKGSSFGGAMGDVHSLLAWALLILIGLHVVAALFHRFVLKDGVMQRMAPWFSGPSVREENPNEPLG
jgi:cytochrome b561